MKWIGRAAWLAALAMVVTHSHAEATIKLRVHHLMSARSAVHTGIIEPWCERIQRDSQGRMACEIYPAMQLGGTPNQLFDQVKDGVADVVWTLPGYSRGRFSKLEVFELPFMMTSAQATSKAAWDYAAAHAQDELAGVKPLAVHTHEPGTIYTRSRAVTQQADLKGLKLRAPTYWTGRLLAMLGATPVGMPLPNVTEALSRGVIDGCLLAYSGASSVRLQDLVKDVNQPQIGRDGKGLYTAVFLMAMNPAKYAALTPDLQAVIDQNSGREWSAEAAAVLVAEGQRVKALFEAKPDMTMHDISPSELARWESMFDRLDAEWVLDMNKRGFDGQALISAARRLIDEATR